MELGIADIINTCIAFFSAVSAIAALFTCYFAYKSMNPNIKLKLHKTQPVFSKDVENHYFAVILVELNNKSAVPGSIYEVKLQIKKDVYEAETEYETSIIKTKILMNTSAKAQINTNKIKLYNMMTIPGNQVLTGFFTFPGLKQTEMQRIKAKLKYKLSGHQRTFIKHIILNYLKPEI